MHNNKTVNWPMPPLPMPSLFTLCSAPKLLFILLFAFYCNPLSSYQYQLTIGAIFKDEAPYLKEWIEYHRLVGVEHFCLFNHESSDNYYEVLAPYIASGLVDLTDAIVQNDFNGTQVDCFNRTLIKSFWISKWVAMIDADEFLVTPAGINIIDVLNEHESYGGVAINWRCFGTSSVSKIPTNKLMIECLTRCAAVSSFWNHIVKSIVRPERVLHYGGPHWPEHVPGWFSVDTDGSPYIPGTSLCKLDKLWINHYWTRDEDFFYNVKIPRSLLWGRVAQDMIDQLPVLNEVADDCILRHAPALKKRIFKKKHIKSKKRIKVTS